MARHFDFVRLILSFCLLTLAASQLGAAPAILDTNLQLRLVLFTTNSSGAASVRIARDPRNNQLYYLKDNGDIFEVDPGASTNTVSSPQYTGADHGISASALGMAVGPDGTIYIVGNTVTNAGNSTFARVMKGVPNAKGNRVWSLLAQTEPYPLSRSAFDHLMSGMAVSPDGTSLYLNSGSRTDHGEVESTSGLYPNLRETGLTAKILRLSTSASGLVLTNDLNTLRNAGYVFAEGTRNSFSLAFAPNGDLFGTENGPDRDMSDELNWLRPGGHFGFPWRMGGADNPQQFPNYDPANDLLLDPRYIAVHNGTYHNDPTFPSPPTNFFEAVVNVGPDADSYRDPADGSIQDASDLGRNLSTFTAHRSPLGLAFDTAGVIAPPYHNHGFMLSFTQGDPTGNSVAGPFKDASQDLVDLALTPLGGTNYQVRATRIVGGFAYPIDAAIISNKVYVIEYSGSQGIWEITFPPAATSILLSQVAWETGGEFSFSFESVIGRSYRVEASSNWNNWSTIAQTVATNSVSHFVDSAATNSTQRFYRVVFP
jgi:hypothetical protein